MMPIAYIYDFAARVPVEKAYYVTVTGHDSLWVTAKQMRGHLRLTCK
jgi:hypothetical protein